MDGQRSPNLMKPVLYLFAGRPGSGKTTLAQKVAHRFKATYLRIDTIEQGLRNRFGMSVTGEGYELSFLIAKDNLMLGIRVVADSCNPIGWTRDEWEKVAQESGGEFMHIEIICSDKVEHKSRVEARHSSIAGLCPPTWDQIENREYHEWDRVRSVIDTAGKTVEQSFNEILKVIGDKQSDLPTP